MDNAAAMMDCPALTLDQRVQALADFYRRVQHERMQGIPLLNPALSVEAIGFVRAAGEADGTDAPGIAEGILITPWFMSLVRLPLPVEPHLGRVGRSRVHWFGCERFDFIGAHDPEVGFHETCALFSPMADFPSQTLARETAIEALAVLRPTPASAKEAPPVPSRRSFLFGRRGSAGSIRP